MSKQEATQMALLLRGVIENIENGKYYPEQLSFERDFEKVYDERLGIYNYIDTGKRIITLVVMENK